MTEAVTADPEPQAPPAEVSSTADNQALTREELKAALGELRSLASKTVEPGQATKPTAKPFDWKARLIDYKGNDYLPVSDALVWFWHDRHQRGEGATIYTEAVELTQGIEMVCTIRVLSPEGREVCLVTGRKTVSGAQNQNGREKAETGAVGRALRFLGYGADAAGDELEEAHGDSGAPAAARASKQPAHNGVKAPQNTKPGGAMAPGVRGAQSGAQRVAEDGRDALRAVQAVREAAQTTDLEDEADETSVRYGEDSQGYQVPSGCDEGTYAGLMAMIDNGAYQDAAREIGKAVKAQTITPPAATELTALIRKRRTNS